MLRPATRAPPGPRGPATAGTRPRYNVCTRSEPVLECQPSPRRMPRPRISALAMAHSQEFQPREHFRITGMLLFETLPYARVALHIDQREAGVGLVPNLRRELMPPLKIFEQMFTA